MNKMFFLLTTINISIDAHFFSNLIPAYKANQAYVKNDLSTAESVYISILEKDPYDAIANYNVGTALYKQKKYAEAKEHFERSVKSTFGNDVLLERSLFNQGNSLMQIGEYENAIESYEKVLELNTDNEHAQKNLALARELLEDQKRKDEEQKKEDQQKNDCDKNCNQDKDKQNKNKQDDQQNKDDQKDNKQDKDEKKDDKNNSDQPDASEKQDQKGSHEDGSQNKENNRSDQQQDSKQQASELVNSQKDNKNQQKNKQGAQSKQEQGQKEPLDKNEKVKGLEKSKEASESKKEKKSQEPEEMLAKEVGEGKEKQDLDAGAKKQEVAQQEDVAQDVLLQDQYAAQMNADPTSDDRLDKRDVMVLKALSDQENAIQKRLLQMNVSREGGKHEKNW